MSPIFTIVAIPLSGKLFANKNKLIKEVPLQIP